MPYVHISFLFYMWTCLVKKIIEHCEHALWWLNIPAIILCMNTPSETLRVLWTCLVMPCDRLWSMPNMHASLISLYEHTQWNIRREMWTFLLTPYVRLTILSVWTDPVKQCQHKNVNSSSHALCMLHHYRCVNQPSESLMLT